MSERRTPLYDIHLRTASQLVKGGGNYMFPLSYAGPVEEHINVRTNVGMQDLSTMGEVDIKGPGAERLISRLLVNRIVDMHPGQVRYSTMCDEDGIIIDDVTVYKFDDEHFMIVTSSGPRQTSFEWIRDHAQAMRGAYVNEMGGSIALLSIQGPLSRDFLATVVADVDSLMGLKFFRFAPNAIGEIGTELIVSRTGYTGELGFELYVPAEEAAVLWEHLEKSGRDFSLMPYGVQAMQSLRIEKAFPLAGPDIDGSQNPFELGLHRYIDFKKREFVGREALLEIQDMGLQRRWVGLKLDSKVPAKNGDPIFSVADVSSFKEKLFSGSEAGDTKDQEISGMQEIGYVSSSAKGHSVKKMLALGYLDVAYSWPGARVMVQIGDRPTLATVSETPFFDPSGARLRAKVKDGTRKIEEPTKTKRTRRRRSKSSQ